MRKKKGNYNLRTLLTRTAIDSLNSYPARCESWIFFFALSHKWDLCWDFKATLKMVGGGWDESHIIDYSNQRKGLRPMAVTLLAFNNSCNFTLKLIHKMLQTTKLICSPTWKIVYSNLIFKRLTPTCSSIWFSPCCKARMRYRNVNQLVVVFWLV